MFIYTIVLFIAFYKCIFIKHFRALMQLLYCYEHIISGIFLPAM